MAQPIVMPKFGQMTEEGTIVKWHKKEGERVAKGEVLFEVETDKSVMEVESFTDGILLKIVAAEGQAVPVQSTVGFIGQPGEPIPEIVPPPLPTKKEARQTAVAAPQPAAVLREVAQPTTPAAPPLQPAVFRISPRAAALARDCVIDPTPIIGTGPDGRIVEKDVRDYLAAKGYDKIRITPAAKALAAREQLDLFSIRGSGEGGRITVADVERAVAEKPKPMSKMRQVIAQRLTHSFTTTPHYYVTVSVDMTELLALRTRVKEQGAPYTMTDFIAQAVILGLQEFPTVNSATDGKTVRRHSHVHLGLAVALEAGLVVPVVRNAEELSLLELSRCSKELTDKARAGKLMPDEMSGGTFTISNMGMLGVENFTAIINPGESAILAVSSIQEQPVVRDGKIVVRSMMKMTLSADHRLIDGAVAARFVNAVKAKLEDIELWKRLTS